jgi:ribosomal protein S18 acetylase RimI-like enzyme
MSPACDCRSFRTDGRIETGPRLCVPATGHSRARAYLAYETVPFLDAGRYGAEDMPMKLTVAPLTPKRWSDLEAIFNAKGCAVARGCWCMAYRLSGQREPLPRGVTRAQANRARLKAIVDAGNPPGLIGYRGKVPVGWISIGPREEYAKLKRSPVMKAVDAQPVWSIVCFVVPAEHRGQGVAQALLTGAVAYSRKRGATIIEAYPVDKPGRSNDDSMWFGAKSMYDKAGFKEVARRKPRRPVVRFKPA